MKKILLILGMTLVLTGGLPTSAKDRTSDKEKTEKIKKRGKEKSLHSKSVVLYFASMSFSPDSADGVSDPCLICGDY